MTAANAVPDPLLEIRNGVLTSPENPDCESRDELADAVGSVREVVARVLGDFRVAGIVATSSDSVLILDAARLHSESGDPSAL
jgi:Crp-like helix-turn-helix domain